MELTQKFLNRASQFAADSKGSVFVYVATIVPVLIGIAGLSIDISLWHAEKRATQSMVDSAAMAAALEIRRGGDGTAAATQDALDNGYDSSDPLSSISVTAPASGDFVGNTSAIEVTIQRPVDTFLAALQFDAQAYVSARAVGMVQTADSCVWALNPTSAGAVNAAGSAALSMDCGILVNSTHNNAIGATGGSSIVAAEVRVSGDVQAGSSIVETPITGTPQVSDPLAFLDPPSSAPYSCTVSGNTIINNGSTQTFPAGTVFCGNVTVNSGGTLNLDPGVHTFDGVKLNTGSGAFVNGTGVTLYLTENTGGGDGWNINSGSIVDLSGPLDATDGGIPGVVIYQHRDATVPTPHVIAGGSTMDLEGLIYMPNQAISYAGGSAGNANDVIFIVDSLTISGNSYVNATGGSSAVLNANSVLIQSKLVE